MELKTGTDSGVRLKKRHYGKHRSSLLYGGFVDSATKSHDLGLVTNDEDLSKEDVPKKFIQERCVQFVIVAAIYLYWHCVYGTCSEL